MTDGTHEDEAATAVAGRTEFALLAAERVTSVTLVGVNTEKYPVPSGNCFSVKTDKGQYRIVNFSHENIEEAVRRGVSWPINIMPLNDRVAIIHDERIPDHWYDKRWCEVCCPKALLPFPQKLAHDRQIKQGARVERENSIVLSFGNKPDLGS